MRLIAVVVGRQQAAALWKRVVVVERMEEVW